MLEAANAFMVRDDGLEVSCAFDLSAQAGRGIAHCFALSAAWTRLGLRLGFQFWLILGVGRGLGFDFGLGLEWGERTAGDLGSLRDPRRSFGGGSNRARISAGMPSAALSTARAASPSGQRNRVEESPVSAKQDGDLRGNGHRENSAA